jgi:hypothetical protein
MEGLNKTNEDSPRMELHRLIKEELIAARSTAYNAEEREKKAEKDIEEFLNKHPEFVDKVDEIQKNIIESLK